MKVVVSANGLDLNAPASSVFGRCPAYVFVDTETMAYEGVENPAQAASGGAGIQAAQFVVNKGAQAVLSGNLGPNAFNVLAAANVPVYLVPQGTVREAVEAFKAGRLQQMSAANVQSHAGLYGGGRGMGRGMGMGMGGGRGMGMGMGMRGGMGAVPPQGVVPPTPPTPPPPASVGSSEDEIKALKEQARQLREQLAQLLDRLDQLEKGE